MPVCHKICCIIFCPWYMATYHASLPQNLLHHFLSQIYDYTSCHASLPKNLLHHFLSLIYDYTSCLFATKSVASFFVPDTRLYTMPVCHKICCIIFCPWYMTIHHACLPQNLLHHFLSLAHIYIPCLFATKSVASLLSPIYMQLYTMPVCHKICCITFCPLHITTYHALLPQNLLHHFLSLINPIKVPGCDASGVERILG